MFDPRDRWSERVSNEWLTLVEEVQGAWHNADDGINETLKNDARVTDRETHNKRRNPSHLINKRYSKSGSDKRYNIVCDFFFVVDWRRKEFELIYRLIKLSKNW